MKAHLISLAKQFLETTLIRRHFTLQFQHHNPASLLSGKLHALLQRPYTKGRDV